MAASGLNITDNIKVISSALFDGHYIKSCEQRKQHHDAGKCSDSQPI